MAGQAGLAAPPVIRLLLERPRAFAFGQAVRLLMLAHRRPGESEDAFLRRALRIRPELSLAHPGTDIAALEARPRDGEEPDDGPLYDITATFLSLYGASSPLPTFYTEELMEEARADESAGRDFLDIFNQALYVLYCRACNFHRLELRSVEQEDRRLEILQFSLLGMGLDSLRERGRATQADLAHIALFGRHTRTAAGLEAYVRARTGAPDVSVEQCVPRRVAIPADQRARAGAARLGSAVIGGSVVDLQGGFRLHVHGLDERGLEDFAPGGEGRRNLEDAVRRYLSSPLAWDLVLHAKAGVRGGGRLGGARLGATAWLRRRGDAPAARWRWHRTLADQERASDGIRHARSTS